MRISNNPFRQRLILLSPLGIIALGHFTARLTGPILGVWSWVPLTAVLWTTWALLIVWGAGRETIALWLRRPQGAWGWSVLAMAVCLITLPLFLQHWQLLSPVWVWLPWLVFALINPWLEEGYWRGLLLDASANWSGWLSVPYTSIVFALSHPLMWGVNSIANRHPAVLISTFLMGLAWAMAYRKTHSLRWAIFSHFLVDLFNLSIAAFLNLYIPPSLPTG